MIIIPAIDIVDGKAVRLYQGNYDKKEVVGTNIFDIAKKFEQDGAEYIHLVDLDGAKSGSIINKKTIIKIAKELNVPIEVGGGIRNYNDIEELINCGVSRIILGTAALEDEKFLVKAIENFRSKIAVGVDCKKGYVCTKGWFEESKIHYIDFSKKMEEVGVKNIILTDISKDGTLTGVNTSMIEELKRNIDINITASGGVKDYCDIKKLKELNIYGVIVGKALYSGNIELNKAIDLCR